jgi:very-short-patch-repair endonuclease
LREKSAKADVSARPQGNSLRRSPTDSESRLFRALSGGKLGITFRRQAVVAGYIVDLLAPAARLVIEIDGGWHESRRRADAHRDAVLAHAGYRLLRFTAEEVLYQLPSVLDRIRAEAAERRKGP